VDHSIQALRGPITTQEWDKESQLQHMYAAFQRLTCCRKLVIRAVGVLDVSCLPQTVQSLCLRGGSPPNNASTLTLSVPPTTLPSLLPSLKALEIVDVHPPLTPFLSYLTQLQKLVMHSSRGSR
jgi:hypothetical protein